VQGLQLGSVLSSLAAVEQLERYLGCGHGYLSTQACHGTARAQHRRGARLRAAAASDPVAFRAFWKFYGMTCLPDEVYTDPHLVARNAPGDPAAEQRTAGPSARAGNAGNTACRLGSNDQSSWRLP
jgi:hypothetical protein